MNYRYSNPVSSALSRNSEVSMGASGQLMTLEGTAKKAVMLIALCLITGFVMFFEGQEMVEGALTGIIAFSAITGIVLGLVGTFMPKTARFVAPIYSIAEGIFLGCITALFDTKYPGVGFSALSATVITALAMFIAFSTGLISATPFFKKFLMMAGIAIALTYIVNLVMILLSGTGIVLLQTENHSVLSYVIQALFCVVASLFLIWDFDNIANSHGRVGKEYEMAFAMGLLMTLVWMYLEFLKLIVKFQSDN
ncbi:Bax inhibitor-1/YccA family protein [Succinimonas sp.]|uniref:Bax inhibitor-1/YccA family membrane protein n=1 Tax=Succinimonas sp. TaxID=1936151 RepID=UPI00386E099D